MQPGASETAAESQHGAVADQHETEDGLRAQNKLDADRT